MFLLCFIVLVIRIFLVIFCLIKITQLQFDWDYLEYTMKKHDFWSYLFLQMNSLFVHFMLLRAI